ncbi:MAG: CBS domain-containing protein [Anaerolineae bacterium]|nr:CBS domain-containing protein [Anaerolineae bacterium]MCB0229842.1 CBS domain-containing protein [Anaerolineae bacterium]MCB0239770.1 CBS domain-containing protein [Anaerolineae bacterium]MCB0250319.1 CBS domain-containing protein [Anaerolineae bacterium]MCB9142733.1 CBS domain-containing protein [Anaerolineales bacterium]
MKDRTVLQAKRLGIVSCQRQDALGGIAQRMADDDISALVVVNPADDLAGIISRSDLLRAYMENPEGWRALPVEAYMTRDVVTVAPTDRLLDAAKLMLGNHIHRVVVVRESDAGMIPIAVISDSDLVCDMADAG